MNSPAVRARAAASILFALVLLEAAAARAWNGSGHELVAEIAWQHLDAKTRAQADALLLAHPDAQGWSHRVPAGVSEAELRFVRASRWPDELRFQRGVETHPRWHFVDVPIRGRDAAIPDPASLHGRDDLLAGLNEAARILATKTAPAARRAEALAWVIHLAGDAHQPLHCATAITRAHGDRRGDRGGNETWIRVAGAPPEKLHEVWDDIFGPPGEVPALVREARALDAAAPATPLDLKASDWVEEGASLAQREAWPAGTWTEATDTFSVGPDYLAEARRVSEQRVVLAGRRLAAELHLLLH